MTAIGDTIGGYRIVAKLGEGGMGEVYRAHDTKLGRDVAIKVLPDAFAQDPDRRSRFEREARLLAALHHPHIATIFGVEDAQGTLAIVMELVDGPTLGERIEQGLRAKGSGLPVKDALAIARQLAEALDAAHEKGIVHRDLKPANIKITADGAVKVLDFGLAMAVASAGGQQSAIATQLVSQPGGIVGTAAYMSPEQARGQTVDKRTDIWAFGCVLYEMLTGTPAFAGPTASDVMANVLQKEPEWDALPAATPASVKRLITRCLEKDQRRRLRDIGDVRVELDESPAAPVARASRTWVWLTAAVVAGAVGIGVAVRYVKSSPPPAPAPITRFVITPPGPISRVSEGVLAISSDGRRIAYVADRDGFPMLHVQDVDQFEGRMLPGTQGADQPAFSPDGAWLAFNTGRKIEKVALAGGEPIVLCECSVGLGLTWADDNVILFSEGPVRGIGRVSAQGGVPSRLTTLRGSDLDHHFPDLLPDGTSLLYSLTERASGAGETIYVQSLQSGERKRLTLGESPRYLSSGHLLYAQNGVLFAAPFDAVRLTITGPPAIAIQGVRRRPLGTTEFAVSRGGSIVYLPSASDSGDSVVWVDRTGSDRPTGLATGAFQSPHFSPDGRRLVVVVSPENSFGSSADDLWMYELDRNTFRRLTTDGAAMPVWAPDGQQLAYSGRAGVASKIYVRRLDGGGSEKLLVEGRGPSVPLSWSPDGRLVAFVGVSPTTANDIWIADATGQTAPRPFLQTPFREGGPVFSPDGRYIAYVSDSSGRNEVYVRPFGGPGEEVAVSSGGGNEPVWARGAQELFFRRGDAVMAVDVATTPALRIGTPRRLFERAFKRSNALWPNYDVAADGRRFVFVKAGTQAPPARLNVVLNWRPGP